MDDTGEATYNMPTAGYLTYNIRSFRLLLRPGSRESSTGMGINVCLQWRMRYLFHSLTACLASNLGEARKCDLTMTIRSKLI